MIHIFILTVELQEHIFVLRELLASEAHQLPKKKKKNWEVSE